MAPERKLAARTEPFDSYWQAPESVESGYRSFKAYYKANFLGRLPANREARILVVSCGPGYFVDFLRDAGFRNVLGIDSDPEKIRYAEQRGLSCKTAEAWPFLEQATGEFDLIVCEQELNHLTKEEMVEYLHLCRGAMRPGGSLIVYGLNGANPITGAEALAQNLDHFNTFTEYSLHQLLEYCEFDEIQVFPLRIYVFYKNPLNYIGWFVTGVLELSFRVLFKLYGKSASIFTKKIGAICRLPE